MLPGVSVPASLAGVLAELRVCFSAPTFATFTAMVLGAVAQTGRRTVCGMWAGAGLAGRRHHARAHRFFATAVWSVDAVGVRVADLLIGRLLAPDAAVTLAIDLTSYRCHSSTPGS
jgi:SRSO17 transposase